MKTLLFISALLFATQAAAQNRKGSYGEITPRAQLKKTSQGYDIIEKNESGLFVKVGEMTMNQTGSWDIFEIKSDRLEKVAEAKAEEIKK